MFQDPQTETTPVFLNLKRTECDFPTGAAVDKGLGGYRIKLAFFKIP